jgi:hypothetical protein
MQRQKQSRREKAVSNAGRGALAGPISATDWPPDAATSSTIIMADYDDEDMFGAPGSQFLAPPKAGARRSPSRQSLRANGNRSTLSLKASSSLGDAMAGDGPGGGQFSLAHELAAALMPEPSAGSKLLAEEFGIEYDEGAEGIDDEPAPVPTRGDDPTMPSAEDVFGAGAPHHEPPVSPSFASDVDGLADSSFGSPSPSQTPSRRSKPLQQPRQEDPLDALAADLASTARFLADLRTLDADAHQAPPLTPNPTQPHPQPPAPPRPTLERTAADVIRRINDTARDREGQVRALAEYERELRKLGSEVGGDDVLAQLDELERVEGLDVPASAAAASSTAGDAPPTSPVVAKAPVRVQEDLAASQEWETDPDRHRLRDDDDGDDEDEDAEPASPVKDPIPPPPPLTGPPTAASAMPQLAHVRTLTASLVSSLGTISEQAQVNGAATTDAGRKLRALKNKLGDWRAELDGAERSRARIERWEAGLPPPGADDGAPVPPMSPGNPSGRIVVRRIDGRKLVEEHLKAFEVALHEAGVKTQAIRAAAA